MTGMDERKDQYEETFISLEKIINRIFKAIGWLAERTLTVKDYKEFADEFSEPEKQKPQLDELLKMLKQKEKKDEQEG